MDRLAIKIIVLEVLKDLLDDDPRVEVNHDSCEDGCCRSSDSAVDFNRLCAEVNKKLTELNKQKRGK